MIINYNIKLLLYKEFSKYEKTVYLEKLHRLDDNMNFENHE